MFASCLLGVVALGTALQSPGSDSLQQEQQVPARDFAKELDGLIERWERAKQGAGGDPAELLLPEFEALARAARGTETEVKALLGIIELDTFFNKVVDGRYVKAQRGEVAATRAIDTLVGDHADSPALAELAAKLYRSGVPTYGCERCERALRAIHGRTPHAGVKAESHWQLGCLLISEPCSDADRRREGRELLVGLKASFGAMQASSVRESYAALAEGKLYELDHLQIGMVAPDFETVDENGVKWRLSDYRGKVLFLDFWGCLGILPLQKMLVERYKDEPFAMLGMTTGGDAEAVKEILAENGITWRQSVQGGIEGPLAKLWNVDGWPTAYVLDAKGVIRRRSVDGSIFDDIEKLLAELEAPAK